MSKKPSTPAGIRARVKGFALLPISRLQNAELNWRTHPEEQRKAFRALARDVGSVSSVLARPADAKALLSLRKVARGDSAAFAKWLAGYKGAFVLVDGHLRKDELGAHWTEIEAQVTDLDAREAAEVLAMLDPIAALAGVDEAAYRANAELFSSTEPDVQALIADLAAYDRQLRKEAEGDAPESEPEQSDEQSDASEDEEPESEHKGPEERYPLAIVLTQAEKRLWDDRKLLLKAKSDKAAFMVLLAASSSGEKEI